MNRVVSQQTIDLLVANSYLSPDGEKVGHCKEMEI